MYLVEKNHGRVGVMGGCVTPARSGLLVTAEARLWRRVTRPSEGQSAVWSVQRSALPTTDVIWYRDSMRSRIFSP